MPVNDDQQKAPSYPMNPLGKSAKLESDKREGGLFSHLPLGKPGQAPHAGHQAQGTDDAMASRPASAAGGAASQTAASDAAGASHATGGMRPVSAESHAAAHPASVVGQHASGSAGPMSSAGPHASGTMRPVASAHASASGAMRPITPAHASASGVMHPVSADRAGASAGPAGGPAPASAKRLSARHARKPSDGPDGQAQPAKVTLTRGQFIASLVGAAVVAAVPTALITSCVSNPVQEEEPQDTIDWTSLTKNDYGLYQYYKDGVLLSEAGIDVSEHDGEIDWAQVKAAGVDFAMVRAGYRGYGQGTLNLDNYFLANVSGAYAAGIKVGVYFFSQAITAEEATEEAEYVISSLSSLNVTLAYPIVFDEEPISDGNEARTDGLSAEQYNANAVAFCKRVEEAGYSAMVYGNQHDLAKFDLDGDLASYPVWYAEYGVNRPTADVDLTIWQYSESGSIPGITTSDGQVDLDIRFL